MGERTCIVDDCDREAGLPGTAKGLCRHHYRRYRLYGDVPVQELQPRECEACRTEFRSPWKSARHCSQRCTKRAYYEANRDAWKERGRARYLERHEESRRYRREYYWRTKQQRAEYRKAYNRANREHKANYDRARREAMAEELRVEKLAWKRANAEAIRVKRRADYKANPEKYVAWNQGRRTAKLENPESVGVSLADWTQLLRRYSRCCAYCGTRPDVIHMEHVIPLSRGGRHAIGNILPACRSCNYSKNARFVMEWRLHQRSLARESLLG